MLVVIFLVTGLAIGLVVAFGITMLLQGLILKGKLSSNEIIISEEKKANIKLKSNQKK